MRLRPTAEAGRIQSRIAQFSLLNTRYCSLTLSAVSAVPNCIHTEAFSCPHGIVSTAWGLRLELAMPSIAQDSASHAVGIVGIGRQYVYIHADTIMCVHMQYNLQQSTLPPCHTLRRLSGEVRKLGENSGIHPRPSPVKDQRCSCLDTL